MINYQNPGTSKDSVTPISSSSPVFSEFDWVFGLHTTVIDSSMDRMQANHTFVIAPFYYGNLSGMMAPQKQADGSVGWTLPLDPTVRVIHMGDVTELGNIVAGAFARPDEAGNGEYLPLVGDFMSFNEIVDTLNRQGHNLSYTQVPKESFAGSFPGATEIAETFSYWEAHTYLGSDSSDRIALANKIAGAGSQLNSRSGLE